MLIQTGESVYVKMLRCSNSFITLSSSGFFLNGWESVTIVLRPCQSPVVRKVVCPETYVNVQSTIAGYKEKEIALF